MTVHPFDQGEAGLWARLLHLSYARAVNPENGWQLREQLSLIRTSVTSDKADPVADHGGADWSNSVFSSGLGLCSVNTGNCSSSFNTPACACNVEVVKPEVSHSWAPSIPKPAPGRAFQRRSVAAVRPRDPYAGRALMASCRSRNVAVTIMAHCHSIRFRDQIHNRFGPQPRLSPSLPSMAAAVSEAVVLRAMHRMILVLRSGMDPRSTGIAEIQAINTSWSCSCFPILPSQSTPLKI